MMCYAGIIEAIFASEYYHDGDDNNDVAHAALSVVDSSLLDLSFFTVYTENEGSMHHSKNRFIIGGFISEIYVKFWGEKDMGIKNWMKEWGWGWGMGEDDKIVVKDWSVVIIFRNVRNNIFNIYL